MGGHMTHVMLWVGMGGHRSVLIGYGLGMGTNSKENIGLPYRYNNIRPPCAPKPIMMDMACWWASYCCCCCCCLSQVAGVQVSRCYTPHHFCQPPSRRLATTVSASSYLIHPLLSSPLPPLSPSSHQITYLTLPEAEEEDPEAEGSPCPGLCHCQLDFSFQCPSLGPLPFTHQPRLTFMPFPPLNSCSLHVSLPRPGLPLLSPCIHQLSYAKLHLQNPFMLAPSRDEWCASDRAELASNIELMIDALTLKW